MHEISPTDTPIRPRIWPAVVLIVGLWLALRLPAIFAPDDMFLMVMGTVWGPMIATAGLALWWIFLSRIPLAHRGLGLLVCVVSGVGAWMLADRTMAAFVLIVFVLPVVTTVWVTWLAVTAYLQWPVRLNGLLVVFLLSWVAWDGVRFNGVYGSFTPDFSLRWQPSAEDSLAAGEGDKPLDRAEPLQIRPGDWPGFRGAAREAVLTGVSIDTDWKANPPKRLWERKVGPGWSSCAVIGNHLFTQEQRRGEELVTCYDTSNGKRLWTHKDPSRFEESIAGPGPRATPTFHAGRLYTQGANGVLNCLDAATGKLIWSRDIAKDSGAKIPEWGFAASPLVVQDVVITYAGADGKSVLGYKADTGGEPLWLQGTGGHCYCSPHPVRIDGVEQVAIAGETGLLGLDPVQGEVLWQHEWAMAKGMARVVQPARVGTSDLLLGTGFGLGTRRVGVTRESQKWSTDEVWTTRAIKPYYNDLVVHNDHLYGFDNDFFVCVNLEAGKSKWRQRAGYGNGQVLLIADQSLLLILTETGEIVLVEANPGQHKEIARIPGITGKTWNHPVIAHGKLFIRNGEMMACFELTPAKK